MNREVWKIDEDMEGEKESLYSALVMSKQDKADEVTNEMDVDCSLNG